MPAQFTHRILAEAVLRALPASVRRTIDDLPAYFLGAQGPDIFYFLHIRRGKEKNLGAYFHGIGVYEGLCSLLAESKGSDFAFSYAAGYLTHYAADTVFHPFVYGMIEKFNEYEPAWRGRRHAYIENDLDSYFVQKCCGIPVQAYPFPRVERHINVAKLYAVFIRRRFFGGAERTLHVPHLFSSMYRRPDYDERCLNLSHGEWRNPSSPEYVSRESADDLFARAERECVRLLTEFYRAAAEDSPLLREDFGNSMLTGVRAGVPLVRPRAGIKNAAAKDGDAGT